MKKYFNLLLISCIAAGITQQTININNYKQVLLKTNSDLVFEENPIDKDGYILCTIMAGPISMKSINIATSISDYAEKWLSLMKTSDDFAAWFCRIDTPTGDSMKSYISDYWNFKELMRFAKNPYGMYYTIKYISYGVVYSLQLTYSPLG